MGIALSFVGDYGRLDLDVSVTGDDRIGAVLVVDVPPAVTLPTVSSSSSWSPQHLGGRVALCVAKGNDLPWATGPVLRIRALSGGTSARPLSTASVVVVDNLNALWIIRFP